MRSLFNNSANKRCMCICALSTVLMLLPLSMISAQQIDTSRFRVKTDLKVPFTYLGTIKPRSTNEIKSSNWIIGCETLDRDMTDYEQYKGYIAPLGIKRLR